MATPAHRLTQDQNLNFLYNGATPGGKTDITKADNKKGRLAGRKALNDISNSRKPSALHHVKKTDNSTNVISIEKDPVAVKAKLPKPTEKGKIGGRKALTDVTNSVKPIPKHGPSTGKKLNPVAEEENVIRCLTEERFLHNHQECIKAQAKALDVGYFLKSVGLSNDITTQLSARRAIPLSSKKPESSSAKQLEIQEMPLEDQAPQCCSPACRSPQSPKAPYMSWANNDISELMVIETPKLMQF